MPKNIASLLKWKFMPPTRTPPTFCPNHQHIHWTAYRQCWLTLQQYSIVRIHIKTISQIKSSFSKTLTEPGFWENYATAHFSLIRRNPALLRSAYSQQTYITFFPLTSRLESSRHKCTPLSQPSSRQHTKFNLPRKWVGLRMPKR